MTVFTSIQTDIDSDGKVDNEYLNAATREFSTLAALIASTLVNGRYYKTVGGAGYLVKTKAAYGGVPDEYVDHSVNGGLYVAELQHDGVINVLHCKANNSGGVDTTKAIQAVINYLSATGGGRAFLPGGTYLLQASTETDTWAHYDGGTHLASEACLVMRQGVELAGAGRMETILKTADSTKSLFYLDTPSNSLIADMTLSGGFTGAGGAGHGMFMVTNSLDDNITNFHLRNLYIEKFGAYGVGLNDGYLSRSSIHDVEFYYIGADCIDIKSRSSDTTEINNAIDIRNIVARTFGMRVTGSTALDVTGSCNVNGLVARDFGASGVTPWVGMRLRPGTSNNYIAQHCNVTNIIIDGGGRSGTSGLDFQGVWSNVSNVTLKGVSVGMLYAGSTNDAVGCTISNVVCTGHTLYAFRSTTSGHYVTVNNFIARDAAGAGYHFRVEGDGNTFNNCQGDDSAALVWSVSVAANLSIVRNGGNAVYEDAIDVSTDVVGRPTFFAKGPSTDIDIAITPKGAGYVRFGPYTANSDAAVSGYVLIRDESGGIRKLAVIS